MLVFSRRRGQAIVIGEGIEVVILSTGKEGLKIGVTAPASVPVHRKEVYDQIRLENQTAARALTAETSAAERTDAGAGKVRRRR